MNAIVEAPERAISPKKEVRLELEAMAEQFKMVLPSHIAVDKFQRVALTAINSDPDLLYADRRSLFGAITRAAQDGLLPDKREGALVIFNQKIKGKHGEPDQWQKMVQWMPMIAGVLKKVRQSGEISSISAQIVYANDSFLLRLGDDESIEHAPPPLGEPRGEAIGAYAIATLKDGFKIREVMDRADIEKVRSVSKTGTYGPWKDWWEEMAKKTVIRRLSKRLPMSTDIEGVINDEATDADFAKSAAGAMSQQPHRMTREALEHHASETFEEGRADADHGEQFDDNESDQPPAPSSASQQDDDAASAAGSQEGADAGAAPDTVQESLFDRLTNLALTAQTMDDIVGVEAEFDAREAEIGLADRPALQDEINAARDRISKGE